MYKIFYDPKRDGLIMGTSDGPIVFDRYPYIESDRRPMNPKNVRVRDGKLKVIKGTLTKEDVAEWTARKIKP